MVYEPLHHKYRPQTFGDLVGQDAIAKTLINAILSRKIAPAYLFTGPRGTGKTSSARILSKSLNCLASEVPTPRPCGQCEVCRAIAIGSALDVIEIDAASNTGVDNIREIIERSQFAPVQCRYKVYVIDECLTGDTLVLTYDGLLRIDDPSIQGKQVLSYNESSQIWEYKQVLRWIERGNKLTLTIKTRDREIRCTDNHLIRTEQGWIKAKNVKEGMKILSPVNADAARSFTSMEQMDEFVDLLEDTNLKEIHTGKNPMISPLFWNKLKPLDLIVLVDVKKSLIFPYSFNKKAEELKALSLTGQDIPTRKDMDCGSDVQKTFYLPCQFYLQTDSDLFTELYWATNVLNTQTHTVDFIGYAGHTVFTKENGWNIKPTTSQNYDRNCVRFPTKDIVNSQFIAKLSVILNLEKFLKLSNLREQLKLLLYLGWQKLPLKAWLGGIWMMVHSALLKQEVPVFNSTQKDFPTPKINLLLNGLQNWDISLQQNRILEKIHRKLTTTRHWESKLLENGFQICDNIRFPQWITNLEQVESVTVSQLEKVYDIEVADNHNFVANGLLVHNCHMLSTAAFNALLKTLEEPPDRVIFVLATTDPQRVLPTIISRCQRFDYRRIPLQDMADHLSKIAHLEDIEIDPEAVTLVSQIANGGLRDAESLLDQLSLTKGTITSEKVWELVGAVPERDLLALLQAIHSNHPETIIDQCRHLMNRGREPLVVLQNLASFYLNLLIAKTAPHRPDMVAVTAPTWKDLCIEASQWDLNEILRGQQHLKDSENQLKNTTQPRLWLEVTLLSLLPIQPVTTTFIPVATPRTVAAIPVVPLSLPETTPPVQSAKSEPVPTPVQAIEPTQTEEAEPTSTPPDLNLEQIWQQVLRVVQPMATQSLLKGHGAILSFDGSFANIGLTSEPLVQMVRQRITTIEEAFAKVCGQPVKVNVQLISSKSQTKIAEFPKPSTPKITEPVTLVSVSQKDTSTLQPKPKIEKTPVTSVPKPNHTVVETQKPDLPQSKELDDSNTEIQSVAANLAKFFEGEIVEMNSKATEDEDTDGQQVAHREMSVEETKNENPTTQTINNSSNQSLILGRPKITDIEDDEDIDFLWSKQRRIVGYDNLDDPWEVQPNPMTKGLQGIWTRLL